MAETARTRILLADDNEEAIHTLALILELQGYEVRKVFNGRDAAAEAESFRPAAAILDIGMPFLNGYDVARAIRGASWGRGMLLIAVTGWGRPEEIARAKEAGFDRHFTKPASPQVIIGLLGDLLSRPG
jgi:two-component system, chemotaxis family, CheB/CheR fusion protein